MSKYMPKHNMHNSTKEMKEALSLVMVSPINTNLNNLCKEINKFFPDCECKQVLYTDNSDKLFFGMRVFPEIDKGTSVRICQSDEPVRFTKYYVEIDSKLFDPFLGLTVDEVLAVLLHEIGHLTNNSRPADEIRRGIDTYLAMYGETLKYSDATQYWDILAYGLADTAVKVTSLFYSNDKEFKADEFVITCGYGEELESALKKIVTRRVSLNKEVNEKFIVLSWTLRLYKDVKNRRIRALSTINRCINISPSQLEKRELKSLSKTIRTIPDNILIRESVIHEALSDKVREMKLRSIDSFKSDYYEFSMIKNNVSDQDEAILLMRQINTRISILADAIETEEMSEKKKKDFSDLLEKYEKLRDELSRRLVYKDRFVGVMVNYPPIKGLDY